MNSRLYILHDKLADTYGPIMEQPNLGTVIRSLQSQISQLPAFRKEDYELLELGTRTELVSSDPNSPDRIDFRVSLFDSYRSYLLSDILPDVASPEVK